MKLLLVTGNYLGFSNTSGISLIFFLKGQPDIRRLVVVLYFSKQALPKLHIHFVFSQDKFTLE